MTVYVRYQINGRLQRHMLGYWLEQSGIKEVDYFDGGWMDGVVESVHPHLKFENEEDATAFILVHGGICSKELPKKGK